MVLGILYCDKFKQKFEEYFSNVVCQVKMHVIFNLEASTVNFRIIPLHKKKNLVSLLEVNNIHSFKCLH